MRGSEVGKHRSKGDRISNFLIKIRIVGFGDVDLRVSFSEVIVKESDIAANAETVCDDTGLYGVAEMTVYVLLTCVRISC